MEASRKIDGIGIVARADDDPRVRSLRQMKPTKVAPIVRNDDSLVRDGKCELIRIGQSFSSRRRDGEYIVTQSTQLIRDKMRNVLVKKDASHRNQAPMARGELLRDASSTA